jgi:hypothetical protein
MSAAVLPANAIDKTYTWSVIAGTGTASITSGGLVTALTNGTITIKALANDASGVFGTFALALTNQVAPPVLVTSITVSSAGNATTITTYLGTLQMSAAVLPANATDKTYAWSIVNGTGTASISSGGLVTALTNGNVTVKALANDGSAVYGTFALALSNQVAPPILVTSISISSATKGSEITTYHGTLQMSAVVLPANATNQTYTWSITNQTGSATISVGGLVTAVSDGTILVVATANDSGAVVGTYALTISNQIPLVTSITVTSAGNATTITTYQGTLQMYAAVLPAYALDQTYTWRVDYGTGQASISVGGLLTAETTGYVTVVATANDASGTTGSFVVTLSNQADTPLSKFIRKSIYRGYTATDIKSRTIVPESASIARNATTVDFGNITATKIANAVGSASELIGEICQGDLVNKWSGFSPYTRSVVNGVLTHNKPTTDKVGDFGGYNHSAPTPHFDSNTHASDQWIIPGEVVHFAPTINIGELKYVGGDIVGHSDCVGFALTVWDALNLVASNIVNLATAKDVIYPDALLTGGNSNKIYTVKMYLVNSLSSFDYQNLSNVVCQIAELANYTKAVNVKQGTGAILSAPPGWAVSGTPISITIATGAITFQGLHHATYNGHLTVTAYFSDWLGNKVTDDTVLWTGNYSNNYGIIVSNVVIWKLNSLIKTLPIPGYGYTATVFVNPM